MKNENTKTTALEANENQTSTLNSLQENQMERKGKIDVYQLVTDKIISQLEAGNVPWRKPWASANAFPENFLSKKKYRGINVFILSAMGYLSPYWLTYKQTRELGGHVKKGEKSTPVIYWNFIDKKNNCDGSEENQKQAFAKYYSVFNAEQIEGIDFPLHEEYVKSEFLTHEACESIVNGYHNGPEVVHNVQRACYSSVFDIINMPKKESFESSEFYFSALFHEFCHSTGHAKRLNREGITNPNKFASHEYSKEELVAEMGAAFLCGITGISPVTLENSSAYLNCWIRVLKGNKKYLVQAAQAAQRAADHIQGITHQENQNEFITVQV